MKKKAIVWFRNDLRIRDNVALQEANQNAETIYPIFCIDPRLFEDSGYGFIKTDTLRTRFLLESLQDLQKNLRDLGSDLLVFKGQAEEILPAFCKNNGISDIYASKETTREETLAEEKVELELFKLGGSLHLYWQSTLFHEDDIPWPISRLPDVFTKFRKENEKATPIRPEAAAPESLNPPAGAFETPIPTLQDLGFDDRIRQDSRAACQFQGGETKAWDRLNDYFWERDLLKKYKYTRNGLLGEDYSSKFSPWLSLGCISPRSIYYEVKKYEKEVHKNVSTYWMIFELIWRDYFRFVAKKFKNKIFHKGGIKQVEHTYQNDTARFRKWISGETGIPFIDANMRELKLTGFMSNRGRQNVASFLVKDLDIDWRWGAAWFESQLIDYDVCSNWGNWMYNSGVGNDPRENRYFNIASQAQKYDSKGEYVRHWIPELAGIPGYKIHFPFEMNEKTLAGYGITIGKDYPAPVIDTEKWLVS